MKCILVALASISLISSEIDSDLEAVHKLGKEEVLSLPLPAIGSFLWNRYVAGRKVSFEYYGVNPKILSKEDLKKPATILIHASESNQGEWMNLLRELSKNRNLGPLFTFNYKDGEELGSLREKIASVKALYAAGGESEVAINLIGHSLGGIVAVEYACAPEIHLPGVLLKKVITIASRLKNLENPEKTPFYHYALDAIERAEKISQQIEKRDSIQSLYTIAAEEDWLVPRESVLIGKSRNQQAVIPFVGHVTVVDSPETSKIVMNWLLEPA